MSDQCLFCKIVRRDIQAEVVYEDKEVMAFKDINPQAPVHILFIPKEHIETLNDITCGHKDLIGKIMLRIKEEAAERGLGKGYRVVANCGRQAGQEVFHLHFHLIGGRDMRWPPG
jgi:histidine triad (HIT) family protein